MFSSTFLAHCWPPCPRRPRGGYGAWLSLTNETWAEVRQKTGTWSEVICEVFWNTHVSLHSLILEWNSVEESQDHRRRWKELACLLNAIVKSLCWPVMNQLNQELTLHYVKPPRSWGYYSSLFWPRSLSIFQTSDQLPTSSIIICKMGIFIL